MMCNFGGLLDDTRAANLPILSEREGASGRYRLRVTSSTEQVSITKIGAGVVKIRVTIALRLLTGFIVDIQ